MPPRRSTRQTDSKVKLSTICEESDPDVEDTEYKPHSKRQKTNAKSNITKEQKVRRVRRQGKLQMIVDMPLDILYEIFLYLCPLDILRLSRLNKALSHILMTRNVEFIWRQARLNLEDLPERPVDLNEYQYAKLMFDPTCNFCVTSNGHSIIWSNRRRICRDCIRYGSDSQGPPVEIYGEVARIVPSVRKGSGREDVHPSSHKLFYCETTATQLRDEYQTLQGDDQLLWLIKKRLERQRRIEHGRLCENWMARKSQERLSYLDTARTRRLDAIKAKLTELGWEEELKLFGQRLNELPSVKQPKDLTDRIWKSIKPDIIKLLEDHKTRRLETEYKSAQQDRASRLAQFLNSYRDAQPLSNRIIPFLTDIVKMQPLATMMNAPTAESIEFTDALLCEVIQDWRLLKDAELVDIMCGSLPDTDKNNINALFLATTFFKCWSYTCHVGHGTVGYPEILVHKCAFQRFCGCPSSDPDVLWNEGGMRVFQNYRASHLARTILEASGLDPDCVTRSEVQRRGFFVECHGCRLQDHSGGRRILMTWLTAINHALSHDSLGHEGVHMACADLNDEECRLASELETKKLRGRDSDCTYSCVRCTERRITGSWTCMQDHYDQRHRSDREAGELIEDSDFVRELGVSGYRQQPGTPFVLRPSDVQC